MWTQNLGLTLFFTAALYAGRQDTPVSDASADVRLAVRTKNDQSSFHVGEVIVLELAYSLNTNAAKSYQITNASYDRSGRLGVERFQVEPTGGWDDPLQSYLASFQAFFGGGLSSPAQLSAKPVLISRTLNEWVRFNQPGRYRVRVISSRVSVLGTPIGTPAPEVHSNEISLTIVSATPEWQKATLDSAVAALPERDEPSPTLPDDSVQEAVAVLRYLGTPAAAREMASRLNNESTAFQFMLGLASTPARPAALENMEELMHDPVFPVSGTFLEAMSLVALPSEIRSDRPEQLTKLEEEFRQDLLAALGNKRGAALAVSAYTIVDAIGMRSGQLPPEQKRQLTTQLVAGFDSLPMSAQLALLQYRWQVLDDEAMGPLLPRIAQRYHDFPQLREMKAYEANDLSAAALTHWWEIDPETARAAIIQEILRPRPRFGEAVLGVLPDETLPEVEQQLAQHLTRENGNEEQVASLIARYATAAIEPQVTGYLDQRIGKEACAIQSPLLAYILRVDPVAAAPRLKQAMAARGAEFSACNQTLLTGIAALHDDPSLQELAIRSLDDSDPQIVANAANYLSAYGTAAAEAPLWARLTAWHAQWKDRETEPDAFQAEVGSSVIAALACGQGWLTDDPKMARLLALSVTEDQRRQTGQFLSAWQEQPRRIQFIALGKGQFQIAQYHAVSTKAAIDKLEQFPTGTNFIWDGDEKAFQEISQTVSAHGITLTRSSPQ